MSATMLRSRALRSAAASARATPVIARAAHPHVRTYAATPDPTQPTDSPQPSDVPKPERSNTLWILGGLTAASIGAWYYLNMPGEDVHEKRQKSVNEATQKARELGDAGKRSAQDLAKEGYLDLKAAGKERLHSAEATANGYAADARGAVTKQYDAAKASATDAYNATAAKVGDAENAAKATYDDAKHKAQETQQSWGAWLGSWVGYGKSKAQEAESRAAADVAAGAAKVQREAEKRQ
ncbi:hypothetical protein C8Q72DRAFT_835605 [Fomitopsis betulina]|nr:hypothetical protein C8Q72DRAFT_835605 [Fomitopsis betulina]